jgi:hypothetical protein
MPRPYLFIGLGGSGYKTLRYLKGELLAEIRRTQSGRNYLENCGFPSIWQFLCIDSLPQESSVHSGFVHGTRLADSDYLLLTKGSNFQNVTDAVDTFRRRFESQLSPERAEEFLYPYPEPSSYVKAINVSGPIPRFLSRALMLNNLANVRNQIEERMDFISSNADVDITALEGILGPQSVSWDNRPRILFVSSLSGFTGSAIFLDLMEIIKTFEAPWANDQMGFLYSPDVHMKHNQNTNVASNSLASIDEAVNYLSNGSADLSKDQILKELSGDFARDDSGKITRNTLYVIGEGQYRDFSHEPLVFQTTASALASIVLRPTSSFKLFDGYTSEVFRARGLSGFNSIGYAKVTLGMDLFLEFCSKKLAKEVIRKLLEIPNGFNHENYGTKIQKTVDEHWPKFNQRNPLSPGNAWRIYIESRESGGTAVQSDLVASTLKRVTREFYTIVCGVAASHGLRVAEAIVEKQLEKINEEQALILELKQIQTTNAESPTISELNDVIELFRLSRIENTKFLKELSYYSFFLETVKREYGSDIEFDKDTFPKSSTHVVKLIPFEVYDVRFSELLCQSLNIDGYPEALNYVVKDLIEKNLSAPQALEVSSDSIIEFWQEAAQKYLLNLEGSFAKQINLSLDDWLRGDGDSEVAQIRESQFLSAWQEAISLSFPLCHVQEALKFICDNDTPNIEVRSSFPTNLSNPTSNLGQEMMSAIMGNFPNINPNQLFDNTLVGEYPVNSIDIVTTFNKPMDHYIFKNLMEPSATFFEQSKTNYVLRDFLRFRTARPFLETIPLRQRDIRGIVRGWYVSNLLNLVTETKDRTFVFNPKLSIFDVDRTKEFNEYKELPYPLVFRGTRIPKEDYLAAILNSVSVAFAECSNRGNLDPFRPYQILMEVGGREESGQELPQSDQLYDWIFQNEDYKAQPDAPKPVESVAGPVSGSTQERAAYCVKYFELELQTFKDTVLPGINHKFVIWHAREEVIKALETLIKMTKETIGQYPEEFAL